MNLPGQFNASGIPEGTYLAVHKELERSARYKTVATSDDVWLTKLEEIGEGLSTIVFAEIPPEIPDGWYQDSTDEPNVIRHGSRQLTVTVTSHDPTRDQDETWYVLGLLQQTERQSPEVFDQLAKLFFEKRPGWLDAAYSIIQSARS